METKNTSTQIETEEEFFQRGLIIAREVDFGESINPHIGSDFDDFLGEHNILTESSAIALGRVVDYERKNSNSG